MFQNHQRRFLSTILLVLCPCFALILCEVSPITNHQAGGLNSEAHHHHHHRLSQLSIKQSSAGGQFKPAETQSSKEILERKPTFVQPALVRDGIRVTLSEPMARHFKLDSMLNALDRIAYVISKPAAIVNALKFVSIAVTSLVMSVFMLPGLGLDSSRRRYRSRGHFRYNPFGALSRADLEGMIDLMAKNYDDTLNQAEFNDRSPCRERSLCMFGDMMAYDFPNIIIAMGKFAQNNLPPIDVNRNKYSRAIMLGVNQTDCDLAYKTNFFDCPSFRDYVRSYFHGGIKKRRDHHSWWRN